MGNLNFVDYIILIIFFYSMIMGFMRGLISEIVSLLTLIAAFALAIEYSNQLATYFTNMATVQSAVTQTTNTIGTSTAQPVSYMAIGVSFALIFFGVVIVGSIIKMILNLIFTFGILGAGNRILGAVFGLARGFLINLVIIFLVQLSSLSSEPAWQQSQLVRDFQPAVQWLGNIVSPVLANLKSRFGSTINGATTTMENATKNI